MTTHASALHAAGGIPWHRDVGRVVLGAAAMFAILQGGLTLLISRFDQTTSALIVLSVMLGVALGIERLVYRRNVRASLAALGFRRGDPRAVVAAGLIGVGMLAFFPIYSAVAGTPLALRPDWLWVLVGAIALNGIAEEVLFRGFVFGRLREAGLSFRRAGAISLLVFAAVHLFLFTTNPPVVAFLATLLAVAAAFPYAFLYERAGYAIWATVVLHVSAHAFRLVAVPDAQMTVVASVWILVQFAAVFLVFAFRNNLLAKRPSVA